MTNTHGDPDIAHHDQLRRSARELIDQGVPPQNHGGNISLDALQLLYERAREPESAAEALKLLHELQTYQVELDLMYEQLQANEEDISAELAYYRSLYEQAPAAYLVVTNDGRIVEGNQAAGILFSDPSTDLAGTGLSALLAPGQDDALNSLFRKSEGQDATAQGAAKATVELQDRRRVTISAKPAADRASFLMIVSEAATYPPTF